MLRLLLVCACVVASLALTSDQQWEDYKTYHGKQYGEREEKYRRAIWSSNVDLIQQHNLEYDMGVHTYTLGMNSYGDMTPKEYQKFLLGYRMANRTTGTSFVKPENFEAPETVDWRKEGYVTGIKDQAQCGSCWAFSAIGSLEGQHFRKSKKLVSLSEQNLVDCSGPEGNDGCGGGLMDQAFDYIKKNHGVDTEKSYPYEAQDGKCRYNKNNVGATLTGYTDVKSMDEGALKDAVASVGPVSVAIDASGQKFQLYKHGVYNSKTCSSTRLDHGVLAVGYGSQNGQDYWIVKNSWGESWGMKGYIWMSRNKHNQCGIATQASYPLV